MYSSKHSSWGLISELIIGNSHLHLEVVRIMCDVTISVFLFFVPENNSKTEDGLRLRWLAFRLLVQPSLTLGLPV